VSLVGRIAGALAAIVGLALFPAAAISPQTPVPVELDAPFVHGPSGITVPARIGRFARVSVTDYAGDQLNIGIQLREESKETFLTLFIYRAAMPNVSVWGDFSALKMVNNPSIGAAVDGSFFLGRFTPPNDSGADSGLHARALLEGAQQSSTGMSIFAHDDWIVKLRATSNALSESEITALMGEVLSGLTMPTSETSYSPVTLIEPCRSPLKFSKNVEALGLDMTGQIMIGAAVQKVSLASGAADNPGKPWCRDPQSSLDYGIYREDNSRSNYLVTLSDGGIAALVGDFRGEILNGKVSGVLVTTSNGLTQETWPILDKRPHPALLREYYGDVSPIATRDVRPGADGGSTINITTPPKGQ
jgi:hypothetical protein